MVAIILLILLGLFYPISCKVDCTMSVRYNQTSITRITGTGELYASYASLYSNGTLISYDQDNKEMAHILYTIESGGVDNQYATNQYLHIHVQTK